MLNDLNNAAGVYPHGFVLPEMKNHVEVLGRAKITLIVKLVFRAIGESNRKGPERPTFNQAFDITNFHVNYRIERVR